MKFSYPNCLDLACLPTPIQKLEKLSEEYGRNIWVKRDDLTGSVTTGNKIRKLEFTLAKARAEGATVLITCGGVQSNHCRATAILGAQLGFNVHLLLCGEKPDEVEGNLFLDHLAGAEISYFSPKYYSARLDWIVQEISEEYRLKKEKPYFIATGASDATGLWGYVKAAEEIKEQANIMGVEFDQIVCATGSGGTQAGLIAGTAIYNMKTGIQGFAVCDNEDFFLHKVRRDLLEWKQLYNLDFDLRRIEINTNDQYIGSGYGQAQSQVVDLIQNMLRREGIALDPVYTGKAFYGMLNELEAGSIEGDDILFLHTGGIFGLFAQRSDLLNA